MDLPTTMARTARATPPLLSVASAAAAAIHAAVVPEHLEEALLVGGFFVLAATFQFGWAVVVTLRPSRATYIVGAGASGAMIAIWAASRTLGLPAGPEPWMAEPVGIADATATALELFLVAGSLIVLRARAVGTRQWGPRGQRSSVSPPDGPSAQMQRRGGRATSREALHPRTGRGRTSRGTAVVSSRAERSS